MLGIEDAALTGRAVFELVAADDRAAFDQRVRAVQSGATETLECRTLSADGAGRWVEATFTDLLADAAVGGIVVHLRDVTERRRLEGELRQAQKLESVGQLSAGIAHEMNSPIQFVGDNVRFVAQAFTDLAAVVAAYRGGSDPSTNATVAEHLAVELDTEYLLEEVPKAIIQTLDGVTRMATIVRAMKAFGDPRGDTNAWFDLNEAVRNTLVVAESEIRYVANVVEDLGDLPPMWGNVGDLNQVVLNLVVNAAHAVGDAAAPGRERGTITVRTLCEGEDTVLQIQDTGIGIPPEIAERVFEQFFTNRGVGRGAGQGLAVAYSLVHDRHDGSITFTSEPGVGTTFTVRLPRRGPVQAASQIEELAA
jgi:signal transduction histidine kinase